MLNHACMPNMLMEEDEQTGKVSLTYMESKFEPINKQNESLRLHQPIQKFRLYQTVFNFEDQNLIDTLHGEKGVHFSEFQDYFEQRSIKFAAKVQEDVEVVQVSLQRFDG